MSTTRIVLISATALALAGVAWHDQNAALDNKATALPTVDSERGRSEDPAGNSRTTSVASHGTAPALVIPNAANGKSEQHGLAAPSSHPFASFGLAQFDETINRPLFSKSRRPPPPKRVIVVVKPVAKPLPPREPPLSMKLVGIVTANGKPVALLRDRRSNNTVRVAGGESVQGWKVQEIVGSSVRVSHKKWTRKLNLFAK